MKNIKGYEIYIEGTWCEVTKEGNFIDDTKKAFLDCGLKTYNELILLEQSGTGAMRANKTFGTYRKVIKTHQNVLVFYKGDPKKIKENYKEITIENLDKFAEELGE